MASKKKRGDDSGINMTPMIDVVFQLIIFFVITADMQKENLDEIMRMAMAPNAAAVEIRDPLEVNVDVDRRGRILMHRKYVTHDQLRGILMNAHAEAAAIGKQLPVVIRADGQTKHEDIRKVMDSIVAAKIYRIKFGAIKEKAQTAN